MSDDDRERWDARHRAASHGARGPSPFLEAIADQLPRAGSALDIAGGAGRNARWLAARGLDVTVADISPVGLDLAREAAREAGLSVSTVAVDLEREPLPRGPWDLAVCTLFLHRPLFAAIPAVLAEGGTFVFLQPTRTNLERHPRPPARFLLEDGELPTLIPPDLEVVTLVEGWTEDGHHEARLVARKRALEV